MFQHTIPAQATAGTMFDIASVVPADAMMAYAYAHNATNTPAVIATFLGVDRHYKIITNAETKGGFHIAGFYFLPR